MAAGAMALGLGDEASLRAAAQAIRGATSRADAPFLVQSMAAPGVDVIVGITQDDDFGALLMVGAGGSAVEAAGDVAFSPVPLGRAAAEALLARVGALRPLLNGTTAEGSGAIDREALVEAVVRIAAFAHANRGSVQEFEINPLRVFGSGAGTLALDGYMRTGPTRGGETDG